MKASVNSEKLDHLLKDDAQNVFPVIKFDVMGRILYANKAAFPLLREIGFFVNDYLDEVFVRRFPGILNLESSFSISLDTPDTMYFFDVIGFPESGYIGLYGYNQIYVPVLRHEEAGVLN